MHTHEPGSLPPLLEHLHRHAHQVAALLGVQPCVVALRLDVPHLGDRHEPRHAAELDGDALRVVLVLLPGCGGGRRAGSGDAADGVGEPVLAHGLEHVVDGPHLERVDGGVAVRGDEDDRRRGGEPAEDAREVQPGQRRHADVGDDAVDVAAVELAQRRQGVRRRADLADARVGAQQVRQLVERGRLVVDGEQDEAGAGHEPARTPAANFGIRNVTFVPAPGAVSTSSPCSSP